MSEYKQLNLYSQETMDSMVRFTDIFRTNPIKHVYSIYGEDYQNNIVVEELSELIKAINKYNRTRLKGLNTTATINDIAEEVADVSIVLEEVIHKYKLQDSVAKHKAYKIERLGERIIETFLSKMKPTRRPYQRRNIYK